MPKASTVSKGQVEKFLRQFSPGVSMSGVTPAQLQTVIGGRMDSLQTGLMESIQKSLFQLTGIGTVRVDYQVNLHNLSSEINDSIENDELDWWEDYPTDWRGGIVQAEPIDPGPIIFPQWFSSADILRYSRERELDPIAALHWAYKYLEEYSQYAEFYSGWHDRHGRAWITHLSHITGYIRLSTDRRISHVAFPVQLHDGERSKILVRHLGKAR